MSETFYIIRLPGGQLARKAGPLAPEDVEVTRLLGTAQTLRVRAGGPYHTCVGTDQRRYMVKLSDDSAKVLG